MNMHSPPHPGGRAIARARMTNPNYVIPPSPPPYVDPKITIYQQAMIEYRSKVHALRVGYQKQHMLQTFDKNAEIARKLELKLASKQKRRELVKYEKTVLKAKRDVEQMKLAEIKAEEKKQHTKNREQVEAVLYQRKLNQLNFVLNERSNHWVDVKQSLNPHLFDTTFTDITGYWVKLRATPSNQKLFVESRTAAEMKVNEDDEWGLIDYREINTPKSTYIPSEVAAPQFKRSAADRTALKKIKKELRWAKAQSGAQP